MKHQTLATILVLGMGLAAHGALYTETFSSGFANGGTIPDGGSLSDTRTVSDVTIPNPTIVAVTVTLNISGGWNGDLYAYLSYDGHLLTLLNRVGTGTGSEPTFTFGYGDAGFNAVTLADSGSVNIHNYGGGGVPTGTFLPDSGGTTFASTFGGLNPNGDWTLFFEDQSGGNQSTLTGWSLGLDVVPEPITCALAVFWLTFAGVGVGRFYLGRRRSAAR